MIMIKKIFVSPLSWFRDEKGFALITALLALVLITALGLLVFTVTTRDIRIASRSMGEKKAFSAAESGINDLLSRANAQAPELRPDWFVQYNAPTVQVDPATNPGATHTSVIIAMPEGLKPSYVPGFTTTFQDVPIGSRSVTGRDTWYATTVTIEVGISHFTDPNE